MFPFINPRVAISFQKIFGSPQGESIFISLLNAILYEGNSVIQDLAFLQHDQVPRIKGIEDAYLNAIAQLADGTTIIIEVQVLNIPAGFEKRVLYKAAKESSRLRRETGSDQSLDSVVALTFTDYEMFDQSSQIISRYRLEVKGELTDYGGDVELVFVELPKFRKSLETLQTLTDRWLFFIQNAEQLEEIPFELQQVAVIHDAFNIAQQRLLTRDEAEALDRQAIVIHDYRNAIRYAIQVGEAEAKAAIEARLEIARSLLNQLSLETISETTGLTPEEINQPKQEST